MLLRLFFIFLCLIFVRSVRAGELAYWSLTSSNQKYVFYVADDSNVTESFDRYFLSTQQNPELTRLIPHGAIARRLQTFKQIPSPSSSDIRTLLLANDRSDFMPNDTRILSFTRPMSAAGSDVYILPVAPAYSLNAEERGDFEKLVARHFDVMVPMGGSDVDPSLYGEENKYARHFSRLRDVDEMAFIREFVRQENGFLLGVCRGDQITAASLGLTLIQDIENQVPNSTLNHLDGARHDIAVVPTTHRLLSRMAERSDSRIVVNSWHHQSVRFSENPHLTIAAIADDGVIEALEFKNGRGLLVQFHPELQPDLNVILTNSVREAARLKAERCEQLLTSPGA